MLGRACDVDTMVHGDGVQGKPCRYDGRLMILGRDRTTDAMLLGNFFVIMVMMSFGFFQECPCSYDLICLNGTIIFPMIKKVGDGNHVV